MPESPPFLFNIHENFGKFNCREIPKYFKLNSPQLIFESSFNTNKFQMRIGINIRQALLRLS